MSSKFIAAAVVVALIGVGVVAYVSNRPAKVAELPEAVNSIKSDDTSQPKPAVVAPKISQVLGLGDEDFVRVGDVNRPKRDIEFLNSSEPAVSAKSPLPHPGKAPAADAKSSPEAAGLLAELNQEEVPKAARSALFSPAKFDPKTYNEDPAKWLAQIRPGRVFQPAQPSEDVEPIATDSKGFQAVLQGEKVLLTAQVEPGSPVSFYTPEVGDFGNGLTTRSVAADEKGVARVTYTATRGTLGVVNILAASPSHSGQLRFRVKVSLPQTN
jgi:hypothetical protein